MTGPKLLIVGFGSMGKLHAKYAEMLGVDWRWRDMDPDAGPLERRCDDPKDPVSFTHIIPRRSAPEKPGGYAEWSNRSTSL